MNKTSEYKTIVEWYKKQSKVGFNENEKLGWFKKKGFKKRYQIMAELIKNINKKKITVLDFGCGLSSLYKYQLRRLNVEYTGVDLIDEHIKYGSKKFPENKYKKVYFKDIKKLKKFDYIFLNGVFTVKRNLSNYTMFKNVKKYLLELNKKAKIGIAVNFMSRNVEKKRKDLFHLSLDQITKFLYLNLGNKYLIRNDYNLYEYTIYIYKK